MPEAGSTSVQGGEIYKAQQSRAEREKMRLEEKKIEVLFRSTHIELRQELIRAKGKREGLAEWKALTPCGLFVQIASINPVYYHRQTKRFVVLAVDNQGDLEIYNTSSFYLPSKMGSESPDNISSRDREKVPGVTGNGEVRFGADYIQRYYTVSSGRILPPGRGITQADLRDSSRDLSAYLVLDPDLVTPKRTPRSAFADLSFLAEMTFPGNALTKVQSALSYEA